MSSSSEIILSNQVHPGDSSTETVTGLKFKGDGYYSRSDGLHTVQYNIVGFIGKIVIQATLASDPVTADWFTLPNTQLTATTTNTGSYIYNFTGNYVWVRVIISDWTDGSVSSVLLNH
jgi:hypothetical protein